jgi:hypothetical protein
VHCKYRHTDAVARIHGGSKRLSCWRLSSKYDEITTCFDHWTRKKEHASFTASGRRQRHGARWRWGPPRAPARRVLDSLGSKTWLIPGMQCIWCMHAHGLMFKYDARRKEGNEVNS